MEDSNNIPEVLAGFETLSVEGDDVQSETTSAGGRQLRKRVPKKPPREALNRRCSLRPKKRPFPLTDDDNENEEMIKEYYLNTKFKRSVNSLETIFEEKEDLDKQQESIAMSKRKFNRVIQFKSEPTEAKVRKRRAKIKRIFGRLLNPRKNNKGDSMKKLLETLNIVEVSQQTTTANESSSADMN